MTAIDVADGTYSGDLSWAGMVREDIEALVASTFPVKPPRSWFEDPQLGELTPLSVDSSGHVFGHVAGWRQSHIGLAGGVKAPRSKSNYAFFATGALECDDGSFVNVGQITLMGGHASLDASVADAVAHYDNTRSAVMDVAVGEDPYGIWVAGSLRPDVDEVKLRAIRASSVSGDWRPINGNLELVAVLAVNVPGFPIPRARVAAGQVVAMVAAGTEDLVSKAVLNHAGIELNSAVVAVTDTMDRRLQLVENVLLDRSVQRRAELSEAIDAAKLNLHTTVAASGALDSVEDAVSAAAIEEDVWDDGMDISFSVDECRQAQLRARVASLRTPGAVVATATSHWTAANRAKAAARGVAMPDGSYPIRDKADFKKARLALGRAKNAAKKARAIAHIRRRGRAIGVPESVVRQVGAS